MIEPSPGFTSASRNTLTVMSIIALIGMPLVIAYTAYIYLHLQGQGQGGGGRLLN